MHPFEARSAAVRFGVWMAVSTASIYLVRNPTPNLADLVTTVPFILLFTSLPGLLYVLAVRTWTGTWIAGAAIAVIELTLDAYLSDAGTTSSTAGVGFVALPVLLLVPVIGTCAWERSTAPRRGAAASPSSS